MQAHYTHADPELVEGGQLLALYVPSKQLDEDDDGSDAGDDD